MSAVLKYLQPKLHALTNGLFANWIPDNVVSVGDFGRLKDGGFERCGSLSDYGIVIDAKPAKADGKNEFEYKDKIEISVNALAEAGLTPQQGAKVGISVRGKGAFLYHLSDVAQIRPVNQRVFEEDVARALLDPKLRWEDGFVLVTEIQHAGKATIIASDGTDGKLELKTNFNPTGIAFLSGAKGGMSIGSSLGSMFSWIARSDTTALLRLVRPVASPPPGSPDQSTMQQVLAWARETFKDRNLEVAKLVIQHVEKPEPAVVVAMGPHEWRMSFPALTVAELIGTISDVEVTQEYEHDDQHEVQVEERVFGQRRMTG